MELMDGRSTYLSIKVNYGIQLYKTYAYSVDPTTNYWKKMNVKTLPINGTTIFYGINMFLQHEKIFFP